jgi:hypothetical protein
VRLDLTTERLHRFVNGDLMNLHWPVASSVRRRWSPSRSGWYDPRATRAVTLCREWAEEHWEAVGMIASIVCAVTLATILAVAFNLVGTA